MFIRQKKTARGTTIYALVENCRVDGKVKQRVVAHLGQSPTLMGAILHREHAAQWAQRRADEEPSRAWLYKRRNEWGWNYRKLKRGGCANWKEYAEKEWAKTRQPFRELHDRYIEAMRKLEAVAKRGMTEEQQEEWNTAYYEYRRQQGEAEAERDRQFFARLAAISGGLKSRAGVTFEDTTEDVYCGA